MNEISKLFGIIRGGIKKDLPDEDKALADALLALAEIFVLDIHQIAQNNLTK
jgi:hypothetical protein